MLKPYVIFETYDIYACIYIYIYIYIIWGNSLLYSMQKVLTWSLLIFKKIIDGYRKYRTVSAIDCIATSFLL